MYLERLYQLEIGTLEQTRSSCFFQFALMNIEVEWNSSSFLGERLDFKGSLVHLSKSDSDKRHLDRWYSNKARCFKILDVFSLHYPTLHFPQITKNFNQRHISLTRTDTCNSKPSEKVQFEKKILIFVSISENQRKKSNCKGLISLGLRVFFEVSSIYL